ncbi:MAG: elongation factor P [Methanothrix sp.]|nr:elongation factor P [Methanothrix sp.]
MILVSEIKEGTAIQLEEKIYRVLEIVRHAGSGQMHGFIELKLKDLRFGHIADRRFKQTEKLETVELTKRPMEYLYHDARNFVFMDPETYEQIQVPNSAAGIPVKFLKEGSVMPVELLGQEPIEIQFPKVVELAVTMTGPGIRDGQDNTMKTATLENGAEILVPQFIETGDVVRVDTEKIKYVDRVLLKKI